MPTKGSGRRHEAIALHTPGAAAAADHLTQHPTDTDTDVDEVDPWSDVTDDPSEPGQPQPSQRTSRRTYRGRLVDVEMQNVTAVREAMRSDGGLVDDITVSMPDDVEVRMPVAFSSQDVFYGMRRTTIEAGTQAGLGPGTCTCGRDNCGHRTTALEAVRGLVNAQRIRSGIRDWETSSARVRQLWSQDLQESLRVRAQAERPAPDGPNWVDDRTEFQRAYRAAKNAQAAGDNPIEYMTDNATDGLGARDGGRAFGVEIEFDVTDTTALAAIGRDLHAAGLTTTPTQQGYHSGRGDYSQWRFERDCTVSGEIVSPIMYDEPQTWQQLQQVCDIVKRHGGQATIRAGGHVHVGVGDYDHTPQNHHQLLQLFGRYEDPLYRLAQNPGRRWHRGTSWCEPNMVPSQPYQASDHYQRRHASHRVGLNFGAVGGHHTDHVEFRMWDGSLDPATIQTHIKLSLAMADHAFHTAGTDDLDGSGGNREGVGTHYRRNRQILGSGQRLTGDNWRGDTESFRSLMDRLFRRQADRRQATALFAVTRWQRR